MFYTNKQYNTLCILHTRNRFKYYQVCTIMFDFLKIIHKLNKGKVMLMHGRVCWGGTKVISLNYCSKCSNRGYKLYFFLQTYSHVLKHLSAGVDRRDLLSWQDRTDVFSRELLRSSAHPLLLAVPPQPHHGGQVLHCVVVHAARQMRELPLNILTFWGKKTCKGGKKTEWQCICPSPFAKLVQLCALLTVNSQRSALGKEGFGLLRLCPLARVGGILRHQFEEVKEKLVKAAASLEILGIMGTQLEGEQTMPWCKNTLRLHYKGPTLYTLSDLFHPKLQWSILTRLIIQWLFSSPENSICSPLSKVSHKNTGF